MAAQQHVRTLVEQLLPAQGIHNAQLWVYASPLNTVLWHVLAITPMHSHEGIYNRLDKGMRIPFIAHERDSAYLQRWVQTMQRFTQGPMSLEVHDDRVLLTDLRMGQEPHYSFVFDLGTPAQLDAGQVQVRRASDVRAGGMEFAALWQKARRLYGHRCGCAASDCAVYVGSSRMCGTGHEKIGQPRPSPIGWLGASP